MNQQFPTCASLSEHDQCTVWVPATITSLRKVRLGTDSAQRVQVCLADASGQLSLLLPVELENRASELRLMRPVMAQVSIRTFHWGIGGNLLRWEPTFLHDLTNDARLLPRCHCPQKATRALQGLVEAVDGISTSCIRDAINSLVRASGSRLMSAPASWRDHHAYSGGLLVHTVEVIQLAAQEADLLFPFDDERRDLVQLIALAHDFAKTEQYVPGASHPVTDALGHKLASLAAVTPVLHTLATANEDLGRLAARMMEWLCRPAHLRKIRECAEAELVQRADELSAMTQFTGGFMPIQLLSEGRVVDFRRPALATSNGQPS